jgi:hypothetical protein
MRTNAGQLLVNESVQTSAETAVQRTIVAIETALNAQWCLDTRRVRVVGRASCSSRADQGKITRHGLVDAKAAVDDGTRFGLYTHRDLSGASRPLTCFHVHHLPNTTLLFHHSNTFDLHHKSCIWQTLDPNCCSCGSHTSARKHLVPLFIHASVVPLHLGQVNHSID